MHERELPKLNKNKFSSWKDQMKLHLSGIGDDVTHWLENEYVTPVDPLTMDQMNEKRNHYSMMIYIASSLTNVEFDDVKNCTTAKHMWDKIKLVHGGDNNVRRAKVESLRGKYDDMRMKEGEHVAQCVNRIKYVVSGIRVVGG